MSVAAPRLDQASLAEQKTHRLGYDRAAVRPGIFHLGVGNFHRAHQAVYVDAILARAPAWGIVGASLRRTDLRDALLAQDFLYASLARDGDATSCKVVGSLLDCLHVPSDPAAAVAQMADPGIKLVTLTITEKGYCHQPASGELDLEHEDVRADLAAPARPATAVGLLVAALKARREAGVDPFAIVSCDNMPGNGALCARLLGQHARELDPELARWIAGEVRCPSTMVDRIAPATTAEDREEARRLLGLADAWPVAAESFGQWVVESFPGPCPPLAEAGVEFVDDVKPYEEMKLRVLNGSHFALAFLGLLRGRELVAECVADDRLLGFVRAMLLDEALPAFSPPPGADPVQYVESTLRRFANRSVKHSLRQIATDGSQKIGPRILDALRANYRAGLSCPRLETVVAAWICHWCAALRGQETASPDPYKKRMEEHWARSQGELAGFAAAVVQDRGLFGDLASDAGLGARVGARCAACMADPAAVLAG